MIDFLVSKAYAQQREATPVVVSPGGGSSLSFENLFRNINNEIITPIIYLLLTLAIVYFIWGVFDFIRNADSAEKRTDGYKHMIWGIVGIFIMVSAKGIVNLILRSMGL